MPELFIKFVVAVVRYREQSVIDAKRVQIVRAGRVAANLGYPVVQVLAVEKRDPLFRVRRLAEASAAGQHYVEDNDNGFQQADALPMMHVLNTSQA